MRTHHHPHNHDAGHRQDGHGHPPADFGRAFAIGAGLNLAYIVVEVILGLAAHSLALVADAGHNLSDALGLAMAWGASVLSSQKPTARHTYGYRRSSILAALFNALFLLIALGAVSWEAMRRFWEPAPVSGPTMIVVAAAGIFINGLTAWLFMAGRKQDLNVRGAFLHMAGDAAVSAGVVLTGLIIAVTRWDWVDPAVSLAIAALILVGTWSLLRDSVRLSMDAVPPGIDPAKVHALLRRLPGVREVHDLHVWPISTTETALTAHLVVPDYLGEEDLLRMAAHELRQAFEIRHVTLQVERGEWRCFSAEEGAV